MSRAIVNAGWDDVPHLDEQMKADMLKSTAPHLRDARSKGIPSIGEGAVYPVPIDDVFIDPLPIPAFWPRIYGLDVGWNNTAAAWGAWDRDSDIIYVYSEYLRGKVEPAVHAAAIKARGSWIPGEVDPASQGSSQIDGRKLLAMYRREGLKLRTANNAVEAGIAEVYQRLTSGRLFFFKTLTKTRKEYMLYRRGEDGRIIKKNDHLMDAIRYLVMGIAHARCRDEETVRASYTPADRITGY